MALALVAAMAAAWLDVPVVQQSGNGCGVACVLMVLRYWDANAPPAPRDVEDALLSSKDGGTSAAAMEEFFRKRGYESYAFRGVWTDLEQHISRGRPLIVSLGRGGDALAHFVVVAGVDTQSGLVLVNDPAGTKLAKLHRATFEKNWEESGRWTLLALPGKK